MNFTLAQRLQEIAPFRVMEVIKRAAELEQAGRSVIHMGIGEPDFPTAEPVLKAAARAGRRCHALHLGDGFADVAASRV
jgi:aspartate/methionine/tyrosine aminotransferase